MVPKFESYDAHTNRADRLLYSATKVASPLSPSVEVDYAYVLLT